MLSPSSFLFTKRMWQRKAISIRKGILARNTTAQVMTASVGDFTLISIGKNESCLPAHCSSCSHHQSTQQLLIRNRQRVLTLMKKRREKMLLYKRLHQLLQRETNLLGYARGKLTSSTPKRKANCCWRF